MKSIAYDTKGCNHDHLVHVIEFYFVKDRNARSIFTTRTALHFIVYHTNCLRYFLYRTCPIHVQYMSNTCPIHVQYMPMVGVKKERHITIGSW